MIDKETKEEYLIFAIGYSGEDKLVICKDDMKICAIFTRPEGYMFGQI